MFLRPVLKASFFFCVRVQQRWDNVPSGLFIHRSWNVFPRVDDWRRVFLFVFVVKFYRSYSYWLLVYSVGIILCTCEIEIRMVTWHGYANRTWAQRLDGLSVTPFVTSRFLWLDGCWKIVFTFLRATADRCWNATQRSWFHQERNCSRADKCTGMTMCYYLCFFV